MSIHRNANRGFTLVELLVVIGIIALLISILLPTLNKARSAANTVKCLANLKQLATASIMYENDNRGVLPPIAYRGAAAGTGAFWPSALVSGKYVFGSSNRWSSSDKGRQSVFQCPQGDSFSGDSLNSRDDGNTSAFPQPLNQLADYGMMNFKNAGWGDPILDPSKDSVVTTNYAANGIQAYGSNVTSTILGRPVSEYFPFVTWPDDASVTAGTAKRPNAFKVSSAKQSALVAMFFDGIYCHDRSPAYMTLRHGKPSGTAAQRSSNFAFLDGHAETIAAQDMPSQARGDNMYDSRVMSTNNDGKWKVRMIVKPMI